MGTDDILSEDEFVQTPKTPKKRLFKLKDINDKNKERKNILSQLSEQKKKKKIKRNYLAEVVERLENSITTAESRFEIDPESDACDYIELYAIVSVSSLEISIYRTLSEAKKELEKEPIYEVDNGAINCFEPLPEDMERCGLNHLFDHGNVMVPFRVPFPIEENGLYMLYMAVHHSETYRLYHIPVVFPQSDLEKFKGGFFGITKSVNSEMLDPKMFDTLTTDRVALPEICYSARTFKRGTLEELEEVEDVAMMVNNLLENKIVLHRLFAKVK